MWKTLNQYLIHATFLWFLLIFVLCATPGQYIPSFSWLDLLSFDKMVHASLFFVQCTLLFIIGYKFSKSQVFFIVSLLLAILYGLSLEWMQANIFINRSADWNDMIANSFGCFLAFVLRSKIYKLFNSKLRLT